MDLQTALNNTIEARLKETKVTDWHRGQELVSSICAIARHYGSYVEEMLPSAFELNDVMLFIIGNFDEPIIVNAKVVCEGSPNQYSVIRIGGWDMSVPGWKTTTDAYTGFHRIFTRALDIVTSPDIDKQQKFVEKEFAAFNEALKKAAEVFGRNTAPLIAC